VQDKFEWPKPEEEADERLIRNVREYGCHILRIAGDDQTPDYAFSIGLYVNYDHPELVIFGLSSDASKSIINDIRDRAKAGQKFADGDICDDVLVGANVSFARVPLQAYDTYLGTAIWFYSKSPRPFPCLQIVWPDREGRFPWDTGFDAEMRRFQPVLKSLS
jgi:hypothetical protein